MTLYIIGFGLFRLLCFAFLLLLFIKIATVIRVKMNEKHSDVLKTHGNYQAVSLAARRFADGDISAEQYREIKSVLKE